MEVAKHDSRCTPTNIAASFRLLDEIFVRKQLKTDNQNGQIGFGPGQRKV